jgi:hypothetical protein
MPLDAEQEGRGRTFVALGFDRFDDPVGAPGHDVLAPARGGDTLVVQAVDEGGLAARDRGEAGPGHDRDRMPVVGGELVGRRLRALGREMGVESAARRQRHQLHAVADPEDRQAPGAGRLE